MVALNELAEAAGEAWIKARVLELVASGNTIGAVERAKEEFRRKFPSFGLQ